MGRPRPPAKAARWARSSPRASLPAARFAHPLAQQQARSRPDSPMRGKARARPAWPQPNRIGRGARPFEPGFPVRSRPSMRPSPDRRAERPVSWSGRDTRARRRDARKPGRSAARRSTHRPLPAPECRARVAGLCAEAARAPEAMHRLTLTPPAARPRRSSAPSLPLRPPAAGACARNGGSNERCPG
jgi:hypothetical protein